MIRFATFPLTWMAPAWVERIVEVFRRHEESIGPGASPTRLSSEEVLAVVAGDMEALGFHIEKVRLADLKGAHGGPNAGAGAGAAAHYHLDVYHAEWHCCMAIENGPVWANYAIDEDAVEPLLVTRADTLCLVVPGAEALPDSEYDRACALARSLYGRSRTYLPHRLVLIGY